MLVTIEKRKNWNHIVGTEFTKTYTNETAAISAIENAITEREYFLGESVEIEPSLQSLQKGSYDIETGDFTYYITIQ